jgi:hypothetical protein
MPDGIPIRIGDFSYTSLKAGICRASLLRLGTIDGTMDQNNGVFHMHRYFDFTIGSVNVNVLPCPSPVDSAQMRPPCASTSARAIVRPMPLPPPA